MFSQYEIDLVNSELQVLADQAREQAIVFEYEEMIEAIMYEQMMQEYASHSYDADAVMYGVGA